VGPRPVHILLDKSRSGKFIGGKREEGEEGDQGEGVGGEVGVLPVRGVGAVLTRRGCRARVIPRAGCHATPDVRVFRFKMPAERSDDHLRRLVVWLREHSETSDTSG
jgi:hypothetical protein